MLSLKNTTGQNIKTDAWSFFTVCWMLTLLSSSIGRYMNYSYAMTLIAFIVYIIRSRQINFNYINILWGILIGIFPLFNYLVHTPDFLLIDILGYVVSLSGIFAVNEPARRFDGIILYMKLRALIEAFFVILQQFVYPVYVKFAWRILGTWNYDAGGMALSISLSAYIIVFGIGAFLFCKNGKNSVGYMLSVIFCFTALVFTDKRTIMLIALVLCMLVYFINCNQKTRMRRILLLPILVIFLAGFSIWFYRAYGNENAIGRIIETLVNFSEQKDISNSRNDIHAVAWKLWGESAYTKLFGIGWGEFKQNFTLFKNTSQVHNIYLQLLCETGITGVVCFVSVQLICLFSSVHLFIRFFRENSSRRDLIGFSITGQFVFGVYGFTGNPLYDSTCYLMYFMMITILIVVRRSYRLERRQQ